MLLDPDDPIELGGAEEAEAEAEAVAEVVLELGMFVL